MLVSISPLLACRASYRRECQLGGGQLAHLISREPVPICSPSGRAAPAIVSDGFADGKWQRVTDQIERLPFLDAWVLAGFADPYVTRGADPGYEMATFSRSRRLDVRAGPVASTSLVNPLIRDIRALTEPPVSHTSRRSTYESESSPSRVIRQSCHPPVAAARILCSNSRCRPDGRRRHSLPLRCVLASLRALHSARVVNWRLIADGVFLALV